MSWESIGSTSTGQMPHDEAWIVLSLDLAKRYIAFVCGEPPPGNRLDIMWHDYDLGSYPSLGIWSDYDPPLDYINACEHALEVFDEAVSWHELKEHFEKQALPEVDDAGKENVDDGQDDIDASDLPLQLPFHVSVSDRLASDTDVWNPSGDYATSEEAIAAARKIVDDQLEADFRKNPEDRPLMLLDGLLDFGFIPYVTGPGGESLFNARWYAEKKCYALKGMEPPSKLLWGGSNV